MYKRQVMHGDKEIGTVEWPMLGDHNVLNGLAALAACDAVGVDVASVIPSLAEFSSVKPVSYTHLDVYKRQRYGASLSRTITGITAFWPLSAHSTAARPTAIACSRSVWLAIWRAERCR